jgi:hypothetical protein
MVVLLALRDSEDSKTHMQVFSTLAGKLMNDDFRKHLLQFEAANQIMRYLAGELGLPVVQPQSAWGKTLSFLLQFCPACIKRVQILLGRFHFSVRGDEPGSVAGNRRVFQCTAFALQILLGFRNTLLNTGIFACFEV